jgi:hypothetical protein
MLYGEGVIMGSDPRQRRYRRMQRSVTCLLKQAPALPAIGPQKRLPSAREAFPIGSIDPRAAGCHAARRPRHEVVKRAVVLPARRRDGRCERVAPLLGTFRPARMRCCQKGSKKVELVLS